MKVFGLNSVIPSNFCYCVLYTYFCICCWHKFIWSPSFIYPFTETVSCSNDLYYFVNWGWFLYFVDLDHYTTGLVCDWRQYDRNTVWRNADLPSTVSRLLCGFTRDIAPTCRRFPTDLSFKETSILPLRKLFIQHLLVHIYKTSMFNYFSLPIAITPNIHET